MNLSPFQNGFRAKKKIESADLLANTGSGAHDVRWTSELHGPRGTSRSPRVRTLGFGIALSGTKKQEWAQMSSPVFTLPAVGLEPTHSRPRQILSLLRLPIPTCRHILHPLKRTQLVIYHIRDSYANSNSTFTSFPETFT